MRKLILFVVVALAIGALFGQLMISVPGYWLVRVGDTSLQTSFWFGLIIIFVAVLIIYFVLRLLWGMRHPFKRVRSWNSRTRHRQALKRTVSGLVDLAEGRWKHAQKVLTRAANDSSVPLINYLNAAQAAHYQGHYDQAEALLKDAKTSTRGADSAIDLMEAQLLLDRGKSADAIEGLKGLEKHTPDHPQVLNLLKRAYMDERDWEGVRTIMPRLKRYALIDDEEATALEKRVYTELFKEAPAFASSTAISSISNRTVNEQERVEELWRDMPENLREDPDMELLYVSALSRNGQAPDAERLLRKSLKRKWDGSLVLRYGLVDVDAASQLKHAEQWLKEHPKDPDLLLTLGRLSLRNNYWRKAQEYFESSNHERPSGTASAELARLYSSLGEQNKSELFYRKSAELLERALPTLPQPHKR